MKIQSISLCLAVLGASAAAAPLLHAAGDQVALPAAGLTLRLPASGAWVIDQVGGADQLATPDGSTGITLRLVGNEDCKHWEPSASSAIKRDYWTGEIPLRAVMNTTHEYGCLDTTAGTLEIVVIGHVDPEALGSLLTAVVASAGKPGSGLHIKPFSKPPGATGEWRPTPVGDQLGIDHFDWIGTKAMVATVRVRARFACPLFVRFKASPASYATAVTFAPPGWFPVAVHTPLAGGGTSDILCADVVGRTVVVNIGSADGQLDGAAVTPLLDAALSATRAKFGALPADGGVVSAPGAPNVHGRPGWKVWPVSHSEYDEGGTAVGWTRPTGPQVGITVYKETLANECSGFPPPGATSSAAPDWLPGSFHNAARLDKSEGPLTVYYACIDGANGALAVRVYAADQPGVADADELRAMLDSIGQLVGPLVGGPSQVTLWVQLIGTQKLGVNGYGAALSGNAVHFPTDGLGFMYDWRLEAGIGFNGGGVLGAQFGMGAAWGNSTISFGGAVGLALGGILLGQTAPNEYYQRFDGLLYVAGHARLTIGRSQLIVSLARDVPLNDPARTHLELELRRTGFKGIGFALGAAAILDDTGGMAGILSVGIIPWRKQ